MTLWTEKLDYCECFDLLPVYPLRCYSPLENEFLSSLPCHFSKRQSGSGRDEETLSSSSSQWEEAALLIYSSISPSFFLSSFFLSSHESCCNLCTPAVLPPWPFPQNDYICTVRPRESVGGLYHPPTVWARHFAQAAGEQSRGSVWELFQGPRALISRDLN